MATSKSCPNQKVESLLTKESTGFGQHADYVFGWEGDSLQRAMDNACYLRNCSLLTGMAPSVKNLCQVPVTVKEDLDACKCSNCFLETPTATGLETRRLLTGLIRGLGLDELPGGGKGM